VPLNRIGVGLQGKVLERRIRNPQRGRIRASWPAADGHGFHFDPEQAGIERSVMKHAED
jgi:hypothetical protein